MSIDFSNERRLSFNENLSAFERISINNSSNAIASGLPSILVVAKPFSGEQIFPSLKETFPKNLLTPEVPEKEKTQGCSVNLISRSETAISYATEPLKSEEIFQLPVMSGIK